MCVKLDPHVDFGDVRQPSSPGRWTTDYLIDACDLSGITGPCGTFGLTLFLGSNVYVTSSVIILISI